MESHLSTCDHSFCCLLSGKSHWRHFDNWRNCRCAICHLEWDVLCQRHHRFSLRSFILISYVTSKQHVLKCTKMFTSVHDTTILKHVFWDISYTAETECSTPGWSHHWISCPSIKDVTQNCLPTDPKRKSLTRHNCVCSSNYDHGSYSQMLALNAGIRHERLHRWNLIWHDFYEELFAAAE